MAGATTNRGTKLQLEGSYAGERNLRQRAGEDCHRRNKPAVETGGGGDRHKGNKRKKPGSEKGNALEQGGDKKGKGNITNATHPNNSYDHFVSDFMSGPSSFIHRRQQSKARNNIPLEPKLPPKKSTKYKEMQPATTDKRHYPKLMTRGATGELVKAMASMNEVQR